MKIKHTPGPWVLVKRHSSFVCSVVHEAGSTFISVVDECTEANAQLIAAAPDMLDSIDLAVEALRLLSKCEGVEDQTGLCLNNVIEEIENTAKKARGE